MTYVTAYYDIVMLCVALLMTYYSNEVEDNAVYWHIGDVPPCFSASYVDCLTNDKSQLPLSTDVQYVDSLLAYAAADCYVAAQPQR